MVVWEDVPAQEVGTSMGPCKERAEGVSQVSLSCSQGSGVLHSCPHPFCPKVK